MRNAMFGLLVVLNLFFLGSCSSVSTENSSSKPEFKLNGSWVISFSDPRNSKIIFVANRYFAFSNTTELEYNTEGDYKNKIVNAEADIVTYNNSTSIYIKHFKSGDNTGKYQKIISKIRDNIIIQYHYQLCKTLSDAKKNTVVITIGNGEKIEN
jgi:hypothetical protein